MLSQEFSQFNITYLKPADIPDWQHMNIYTIKRLNDSIQYIGRIKITSTTGGAHATNSTHYKGLAVDFHPIDRPLWHVYQIMRALGWKRIGIDAGQGIIHADTGELQGYSAPYYFLELAGADKGPLDKAGETQLAAIPGYQNPITNVAAGKPIPAPAGGTQVLTPVAKAAGAGGNITNTVLLIGAALPLFLAMRA